MKLSIIGPPGSGKGSQAELFEKELKLKHISVGDLLREESKKNTALGKTIKKILNKGDLVPSKIVWQITKKEISSVRDNFILDGFSRELIEAKVLDKHIGLDGVIFLHISDNEILRRLSNRWSCSCGMTYNLLNYKPRKDKLCDNCGRKLYKREDDRPDVIKKRIKVYKKETIPVVDYYKKNNLLIKVNGVKKPKEVFKEILHKLNKKLYKVSK
ncbi:nucleoside monophosphate kinase [Candidatus Woesearchaeota archaeon]|nr:nucleoside monophosphate kinase [Candidatus Woesearchaeota archaeon]